jgi:hypothetical protein
VIYCVIPPEWADELYDRMVAYYADNPDVTVIVDRRSGNDRRHGDGNGPVPRERRDQRRERIVGTFPSTDVVGD